MSPAKSAPIIAVSLIAIAIGTGVTYGMIQSRSNREPQASLPQPTPVTTPIVTTSPSPVPTPTPTPIVTPSPTVSAPPSEETQPKPPRVTEPLRDVQVCKINQARVNDPNAPLNVRSTPQVTGNNSIGKLENGSWVTVKNETNGWLEIEVPMNGWIAKNRVESNCNQKIERISFATNSDRATIEDRFIGGGSHQYLIKANRGQTITIKQINGVFPVLVSPSGKNLVGTYGYSTDPLEWTGQLPESGDYSLELISNYKGYKYAFSVAIQ